MRRIFQRPPWGSSSQHAMSLLTCWTFERRYCVDPLHNVASLHMNENLSAEDQSWQRAKRRSRALYLVGFALTVPMCVLLFALRSNPWYVTLVELLCAGCFGGGFLIRAWPVMISLGRTPYGKLGLGLAHVMIFAISSVPAKHIVAAALGLPANDFPITVTFWALLAYPGMWLGAMAVIAVGIYAALLIFAGVGYLSTLPGIDLFVRFVAMLLPVELKWRTAVAEHRPAILLRSLAHAFGAAVISVAMVFVSSFWYDTIAQPRAVRLFAFYADYDLMPAYPGVERQPVKLLENGVVSYAKIHGLDVTISVGQFQQTTTPAASLEPPVVPTQPLDTMKATQQSRAR